MKGSRWIIMASTPQGRVGEEEMGMCEEEGPTGSSCVVHRAQVFTGGKIHLLHQVGPTALPNRWDTEKAGEL